MRNSILGAVLIACLPACLLVSPLDEATPDWGYGGNAGNAGSKASGGNAGKGGASGGASGGSSGGTSGSGPSAGSGGGGPGPHVCDDPLMIDDFEGESHTSSPCTSDGRNGAWYLYTDGTGTSDPPPSTETSPPFPYAALDVPRSGSNYAAHLTASGQTDYGGGLGIVIRAGDVPYDASEFSGISFWARGQGSFRVAFGTPPTRDQAISGGECIPLSASVGCNDHFGTQEFNLSSSWQEYTIRFSELEQQGWGVPALSFFTDVLLAIEFAWTLGTFDFWLDDLRFLPVECTDYAAYTCPAASTINSCSYGAPLTRTCVEYCGDSGLAAGTVCDNPDNPCECGATLDPECEIGAVFVCNCLELGGSPCTDQALFIEYYGCYRNAPDWDYVRCFEDYAGSDPADTTLCGDAIDACIPASG